MTLAEMLGFIYTIQYLPFLLLELFMTSIKITGVEKRFGELLALSDINLAIEKGEFFTLLGPS